MDTPKKILIGCGVITVTLVLMGAVAIGLLMFAAASNMATTSRMMEAQRKIVSLDTSFPYSAGDAAELDRTMYQHYAAARPKVLSFLREKGYQLLYEEHYSSRMEDDVLQPAADSMKEVERMLDILNLPADLVPVMEESGLNFDAYAHCAILNVATLKAAANNGNATAAAYMEKLEARVKEIDGRAFPGSIADYGVTGDLKDLYEDGLLKRISPATNGAIIRELGGNVIDNPDDVVLELLFINLSLPEMWGEYLDDPNYGYFEADGSGTDAESSVPAAEPVAIP